MNSSQQDSQKLKISSPEKVSRLLEKAGQTGLPLLIRALSNPKIAVSGRAKPSSGPIGLHGFKVSNLSERGVEFLGKNGPGGVQVEFALESVKLVFYSSISHFSDTDCTLTCPDCLVIERRKDPRFPVAGYQRAFIALPDWSPSEIDPGLPPYFHSSRELARSLTVGDISIGGMAVVERFPAICSLLNSDIRECRAIVYLPMVKPLEVGISIRWQRKTGDVITELDGVSRIVPVYRFGIKFLNPSDALLNSVKSFIQLIAHAEAI